MLAKALAESLKNTQAEPAGAPPAPVTLPPRKKEAPPPPPPRDPPPPEVLEQAKAIEPVTSSHVKALEVKHEIAVVEHALAVKAALAADIEADVEVPPLPVAYSRLPPITARIHIFRRSNRVKFVPRSAASCTPTAKGAHSQEHIT
jgi:hypothetical protein